MSYICKIFDFYNVNKRSILAFVERMHEAKSKIIIQRKNFEFL